MLEMALGSPSGAMVHFLFFTGIGTALGMILYALCAWPGTRRPQFRQFDAMPRLGAVLGLTTALVMTGFAWGGVYRDFFRLEITSEEVRLHYHMPPRTVVLPRHALEGMRRRIVLGRGGKRQIVIETSDGRFSSANLQRDALETAWIALSEHIKPLK